MARKLTQIGPRLPGTRLAFGGLIALALGVALWWVIDTLFPAFGIMVRGVPRAVPTEGEPGSSTGSALV